MPVTSSRFQTCVGELTPQYIFRNSSALYAFGDSLTEGQNATPVSNSYIEKISTTVGKTLTNFAVGGQGVWTMISSAFTNVPTVNSDVGIVAMAGFNDLRHSGNNAKTFAKISNAYRSLIANQFLKIAAPGSSPDIVLTPVSSWTNNFYPSGVVGGKATSLGGFGLWANPTAGHGSVVGWTAEWPFFGDNVVIGYIGSTGVGIYDQGRFNVYIDNILVEANVEQNNQWDGLADFASPNYDNNRGPCCKVYTGLANTSHVLKVECVDNKNTVFDYFGVMNSYTDCEPIVVSQIPLMTNTGYAVFPPYDNGDTTIMNTASSNIEQIVNDFATLNYPVYLARINDYVNLTTDIDVDDVHWNNLGHTHVYDAFMNEITI